MNSDENIITLETEDVVEDVAKLVDEPEDTMDEHQMETIIESDNDELECIDIINQPDFKLTETIVEPSKRISKNKLTRYEFVRIIGERTVQLKKGAKALIKQSKDTEELSYEEIAIEELKANMIPFKIRRPVKDHYEMWNIDELEKTHLESLFNA